MDEDLLSAATVLLLSAAGGCCDTNHFDLLLKYPDFVASDRM